MTKKKDIEQEKWYQELKIKGMTDNKGHYVEMISVDKNGTEHLHWNDGAITTRDLKRDGLFNFAYSLIRFWKINKILIKITFYVLIIMLIVYLVGKIF